MFSNAPHAEALHTRLAAGLAIMAGLFAIALAALRPGRTVAKDAVHHVVYRTIYA